jgi:hypothetical protein
VSALGFLAEELALEPSEALLKAPIVLLELANPLVKVGALSRPFGRQRGSGEGRR